MKELTIEEKAARYDLAIEVAKKYHNGILEDVMEIIFPELKESEDERIRIALCLFVEAYGAHANYEATREEMLAWLEKQGNIDKASYDIAEKEKREFVGDGFIKCYADFQDFKEGETYWLEYVGNDNYNVRSDNLLGKIYHITPCQLYTIFKKQTWLEKQGEKPQGRTAYEDIKKEKVDNATKVEPKFKVGDWIVANSSKKIYLIKSFTDIYYTLEDIIGRVYSPCLPPTENDYHLWTIEDARDGDVLVCGVYNRPFIFKGLLDPSHPNCPVAYGGIADGFCASSENRWWTDDKNHVQPATKKQRDILITEMADAGYTFDFEEKKLKELKKHR